MSNQPTKTKNRLWVLGAPDPEMAAIERILINRGERVAYALLGGERVRPGNAYRGTAVRYVTGEAGHPETVYLVECSVPVPHAATPVIRWILRRDAPVEGYKMLEPLKHLTDAEYKNYKEVKQRAPEGATLSPLKVADRWYRKATDEDDPDDIDSDGEVWDPQNERRIVRIEWTVAGIDVWATERLD